MNPNPDTDERVRQLISELSNIEFEARGLARSRYHDRLFAAGRPRPTNEQFDEGWSAAKNFYATHMRDRCVERVKEIREVWHSVATENLSADDDNAFARVRQRECGIRATSADKIIAALESLTLEQGEQEKLK